MVIEGFCRRGALPLGFDVIVSDDMVYENTGPLMFQS